MSEKRPSWFIKDKEEEAVESSTEEKRPSWFIEDKEEEDSSTEEKRPSWFIEDKEEEDSSTEDTLSYLPKGVTSGEYTPTTMVEDDRLYEPIKEYMDLRYGLQSTEDKSRKQVVARFLNNRRGSLIGNSVRAISEADFLYDIRNDETKMATAGRAYGVYQNMINTVTGGKSTTLGEKTDAIVDGIRAAVLDPMNLAAGIVGKAIGGTASKVGIKSLNNMAMKAAMNELKKQGGKESAKKIAGRKYKKALTQSTLKAKEDIAEFAIDLAQTKGFKRVITRSGLKEIGGTMLVDGLAATGTEYLYQRSLRETGVQEEVDWGSVGISALATMAMGGFQAVRIAGRGSSKQVLLSESLGKATPKEVAEELRKSMIDYMNSTKMPKTSAFSEKVSGGVELEDKDTKFFVELLIGRNDEDGKVIFKGLGQIMQEKGFFYVPRTEDDNVSNWVADFMGLMEKNDVQSILKAYADGSGNVIKGLDKVEPERFAEIFANKMSQGGQTLNAVAQVSGRLEVDLEKMGLDDFMKDAMGLGMIESPPTLFNKWGDSAGANVRKVQNNMIRSLVSHPSTSMLNVIGYGTATSINTASDMVQALLYASRGTLENLVGMSEKGASHLRMSKVLVGSNLNRFRLLFDPDMTQEAFKSALLRNTGALDKLSRVQAGGVEISRGIDEMASMGELNRSFWFNTEKGIDAIQAMTFVDAQDIFTKSQEYMFQMDKNIRAAYGKSFDEFYTSKTAAKDMMSKQYKQIESDAVNKTLEATFSQSFKGKDALGQMAGFIEDARNIPGLGALVPFGKFFNNTINFTVKNTPLSLVGKLSGNYKDVPIEELAARMSVAGGLVYAFSADEDTKRRQGLGLYETIDPFTGEVRSKKYDYPISLFQAAGRIRSINESGEELPEGIIREVLVDFFGGSLTKNITKSGDAMIDGVKALLRQDLDLAMQKGTQSLGSVGSQFGASYTRFLEPVNEVIGLVAPDMVERSPTVGESPSEKKFKNTFRYIDNLTELLTGKGSDELRQSSAQGVARPQASKMLGTRVVNNTDTMRVLNILGANAWELNAAYKIGQQTPLAGNRYQKEFFILIESEADRLMGNKAWRNATIPQQKRRWKNAVNNARKAAKFNILNRDEKDSLQLFRQYTMAQKYTLDDIKNGLKDMDMGDEFYKLGNVQLEILDNYLSTRERLEIYDTPSAVYSD